MFTTRTSAKKTINIVPREPQANGVIWYGNVLRREDWHVLMRKALEFEVKGERKRGHDQRRSGRCKWRRGRVLMVWRRRIYALNRVRWELERSLLEWGKSSHPHLQGINLDQNWFD